MSGECSFFNFCLRGRDSLVSKWISQKRKIPETLKTDGANIYAISEYIHTVFYTDKRGISADGEFTDDKSKSKKVKL